MQPAHRSPQRQAPEQEAARTPEPLTAADRPLDPRDVLALRSHAGNAAMARMLARQPQTEAPAAAQTGGAADVQQSFPVLLGTLAGGPASGAALMGIVQRAFQVVIELRNQMILAGLPVPPAPAAPPPGGAAPPAE